MGRNWTLAVQETVGANRYVPLPPAVREAVAFDHPLDGESVHWNYERHSDYAVLSRRALEAPEYVDVGRYKVYDGGENRQRRVRPPERLDDVVRSNFEPESRVVYLAYDEMVDGENPSVYLLSTAQLLALLPDEAGRPTAGEDGGAMTEALLRMPGFLPPP
jgi:hypothetical protein